MRARVLAIAALLGVFVIGAAAPASAHISGFEWVGTTFDHTVDEDGDMFGRITCTAGETFRVTARVDQKDQYRGFGVTTGTCTGSQQNWQLAYSRLSGDMQDPFEVQTRILLVGKSFAGSTLHDKARVVVWSIT